MDSLKLIALDKDDVEVISTHLQDAVLKVGDIQRLPKLKQFALVCNRFVWEEDKVPERRRTGLHFGRVLDVKVQNIRPGEKETVLSLLTIGFESGEEPSGAITLTFSGGDAIRLEVECIEAEMKDLGPAWETAHRPRHPEETA